MGEGPELQKSRPKMKLETKAQLYDMLFALGQQIIDQYNPCDWNNGKCRRMRLSEDDQGCCEGCKHLSRIGCKVQSLACKLWLCHEQRNMFWDCEIELSVLRKVADRCGIPYEIRRSKEESFTLEYQPVP